MPNPQTPSAEQDAQQPAEQQAERGGVADAATKDASEVPGATSGVDDLRAVIDELGLPPRRSSCRPRSRGGNPLTGGASFLVRGSSPLVRG